MRISTNTIFAAGVARMSELQSGILKTQQQISTGRRILTPADDPVGAARVLDLTQSQSINTQLAANRQNTTNALSTEESVLQSTTSLLQDVKTVAVNAGNGALSDSDRKSMATELRGRLAELIGQANSTDGTGNHVFAGFQVATPPFASTATGVVYNGDQGQRNVQVSNARQIAMSDTGDAVFQNVRSTGVFTSAAANGNAGTGTVSALTVTDASQLTNHNYDVKFKVDTTVVPTVTTYDISDVTVSPPTISAGNAYTAGAPIVIAGQQIAVSGAPADKDTFTVRDNQSQSVFKTIGDLITALETSSSGTVATANLNRSLAVANTNIDNALDNVLTIRASIGSRLKELDSLNTSGDDRNIQYAQTIAQIQEVDMPKAISDFTQQNTTLEAAQKSFVKISGMSLFSLL